MLRRLRQEDYYVLGYKSKFQTSQGCLVRSLKRKGGKERGREEGRVHLRENLEIGALGLMGGSLVDATVFFFCCLVIQFLEVGLSVRNL